MTGNSKECINYLLDQDQNTQFEVKPLKAKRSLNANSYFYVLQNKLANALKTSNDELHRELIKRYSDAIETMLPIEIKPSGYFKYYELYKRIKVNGNLFNEFIVYRPSSEMNTSQFSRLLDGIISECKEVGIQTLTLNELEQLKDYVKNT